jgi:hypothetical protein
MPDHARSASEWISTFAARLGVEVPPEELAVALLDLAGVAAHASERAAAPIACWLAGQAQISPEAALALARDI